MTAGTVLSILAIVFSLISLWLSRPMDAYHKWKLRFGEKGIPGWFLGQWHRLIRFRPDYQMVTPDRPNGLPISEMYGAVSGTGEGDKEWGPPACSLSAGAKARIKGPRGEEYRPKIPDWSHLTDEKLAEEVKTAKLGDGLIAEQGIRLWRKENGPKDA